jgi:hypothetical protein
MRATRAAGVSVLLLLGLTACGHDGGSPSASSLPSRSSSPVAGPTGTPRELAETAVSNGRAAGSFVATIKAQMMGTPVSGKVTIDSRGACAVSLDTGSVGHMEFVQSGDRAWAKAEAPIFPTAVPAGKYLTGPAKSTAFTSLSFFCRIVTVHSQLRSFDPAKLSERAPGTVNDAKARVLATPDGDTVSITDAAVPYVARVVSGPRSEPYDLTFSDWGKPPAVTPPPADQVVPLPLDVSQTG